VAKCHCFSPRVELALNEFRTWFAKRGVEQEHAGEGKRAGKEGKQQQKARQAPERAWLLGPECVGLWPSWHKQQSSLRQLAQAAAINAPAGTSSDRRRLQGQLQTQSQSYSQLHQQQGHKCSCSSRSRCRHNDSDIDSDSDSDSHCDCHCDCNWGFWAPWCSCNL